MSNINAYLTEEDGKLVLHDPIVTEIIKTLTKHNAHTKCQSIHDANRDDIQKILRAFQEKGYRAETHCVVVIQVNDIFGGRINNTLMPNYDWQAIRDQGLEPIARGIADRNFIREAIKQFDPEAASELEAPKLAVVVIAASVAKVFAV